MIRKMKMAGGPTAGPTALVAVALASFLVTLPHSVEDFVSGVPARFGVGVLTGGVLLGIGYAFHALGILLASHRRPSGYLINLLVGLGWFFGAVLDHLPDVLFTASYRAGAPSKLLEVLVMLFGIVLAALS
ncbi:MAG: hypothetical protein WA990_13295, partial [Rubrobacteraceae bacterium]